MNHAAHRERKCVFRVGANLVGEEQNCGVDRDDSIGTSPAMRAVRARFEQEPAAVVRDNAVDERGHGRLGWRPLELVHAQAKISGFLHDAFAEPAVSGLGTRDRRRLHDEHQCENRERRHLRDRRNRRVDRPVDAEFGRACPGQCRSWTSRSPGLEFDGRPYRLATAHCA